MVHSSLRVSFAALISSRQINTDTALGDAIRRISGLPPELIDLIIDYLQDCLSRRLLVVLSNTQPFLNRTKDASAHQSCLPAWNPALARYMRRGRSSRAAGI